MPGYDRRDLIQDMFDTMQSADRVGLAAPHIEKMTLPNEADEKPLDPLASVIALSTCIPSQRQLAEEASEAIRATPIFVTHGWLEARVAGG